MSRWYRALKDCGESTEIRFGLLESHAQTPTWYSFSHEHRDGIGSFARILRDRGVTITKMPTTRHSSRPSLLHGLAVTKRLLQPREWIRWKTPSTETASPGELTNRNGCVAWKLFDQTETQSIRESCRREGVSVNSLLLHSLHRAIEELSTSSSAETRWIVPVNLRTRLTEDDDEINQSSFIEPRLRSGATLIDTDRTITDHLDRGEQWVAWRNLRACSRMPMFLLRRLLQSQRLRYQLMFSNLGDWSERVATHEKTNSDAWIFVPPTWFNDSLSAGCLTYGGRLALSIHVHPSVSQQKGLATELMTRWHQQLPTSDAAG